MSVVVTAATHGAQPAAVATPLDVPHPVVLQLPPLDVASAALYLKPLPPAPAVKLEPAKPVVPKHAAVEPVTVKATGSTSGGLAARAVAAAIGQVGVPYSYGGNTPGKGLDCSALVQYAYRTIGISLPRTAAAQAAMGRPVSVNALQPGDILTFYRPVTHVAIYVGNGKIAEASQPGVPIRVRPMYLDGFVGARRII